MLTPASSRFPAKPIAWLFAFWSALQNQWRPPGALAELQNRKLKRLVQTAYRNVAYYRTLFDNAGISPTSIHSTADLARIPITTKADLQGCSSAEVLNKTLPADTLSSEHSSGSTGQPFKVYYDPAYRSTRNMLFLRGLMAAGYRWGQKVQLVTDAAKKHKPLLRWRYASILDPPERLLAELNREKPDLLYGCKTPLVRLAEHVQETRTSVHQPKRIISTGEILERESRALLEKSFSAEVYDFYGSTEMGLVAWECKQKTGYHLSADCLIVEFLPVPGNSSLSRMVMTNLDLMAMPLIRYESGDLGLPNPAGRCPCGRRLPRIRRVDGRQNDCLRMRDGRTISPYRLTCAMEKIPGILKYQVIQTGWDAFTVRVRSNGEGKTQTGARVRETMRSLLGAEVLLTLDFTMPPEQPAGTKFRVVESMLRINDQNSVSGAKGYSEP